MTWQRVAQRTCGDRASCGVALLPTLNGLPLLAAFMLRYCARGAGVSVGVSGEMDALKLPLSARGRGCVLAIATCARPSTTGSLSTVTLLLTASRRKMSPHKASDPPCHTMANHGCEPPLQAAQRVVLSCHRSGRATVVGKTASLCSRWRVHKLDLPSSPMNVSCRRDFVCGHAHAFGVLA